MGVGAESTEQVFPCSTSSGTLERRRGYRWDGQPRGGQGAGHRPGDPMGAPGPSTLSRDRWECRAWEAMGCSAQRAAPRSEFGPAGLTVSLSVPLCKAGLVA